MILHSSAVVNCIYTYHVLVNRNILKSFVYICCTIPVVNHSELIYYAAMDYIQYLVS